MTVASAWRSAVVALLALSAISLMLAPLAMPSPYSWVEHTTSESAAQGVSGAGVARSGFVLFGLAVVLLAVMCRRRWRIAGVACHVTFGVLMVGAAVFSARSWVASAPFDRAEGTLHSIAASAMGVAFAVGVVAVVAGRRSGSLGFLGPLAGGASVVLPVGMAVWSGASGALQRLMFVIAYAWYGREALRSDDASGAVSSS